MTPEPRCPICAGPLPRHYPPCQATRIGTLCQFDGCPLAAIRRYRRLADGIQLTSDTCAKHGDAFAGSLGRAEALR